MKLGFIGLGKMGLNMITRLIEDEHEIFAYSKTAVSRGKASEKGAITADSIESLIALLPVPRILWLMVPAGDVTDNIIKSACEYLEPDDILIDGGNSFYKDSITNSEYASEKGIDFLDIGTSGGIWGLKKGYCLMIGGKKEVFIKVEPVLKSLAPPGGYLHTGPNGSGHFVKMIHNGIEYALLQSYAEGFELLKSKSEFDLDLGSISKLWNQGSVIKSWLLELAENVFEKSQTLSEIEGFVEDSGEGRWTVQEAIDLNVPARLITLSLLERFSSRQTESFSAKVIAALRNEFGGHSVKKSGNNE